MEMHIAARVSEVLYLMAPESGASVEYAKGAVVGLFAGLLCSQLGSKEILQVVADNLPKNFRKEAIPESWADDIIAFMRR